MTAIAEHAVDVEHSASNAYFLDTLAEGDSDLLGRLRQYTSTRGLDRPLRVLFVGRGPASRSQLRQSLRTMPSTCAEAQSGSEALEMLWADPSDIILVESFLPDLEVQDFKKLLSREFPAATVISLETATASGATGGAIHSPGTLDPIVSTHSVLGPEQTQSQPSAFRSHALDGQHQRWGGMIGSAPAMQRVYRAAQLVSRRDTTVLIQGESGTGKDLLARAIHQASPRQKQPLVVINCAAIPESLLEAELFGHTKGAFTGASQSRLGRVHAAHGGTLFLDEIGDMPLPLQSKILRFLEQGEVQRIGSSDTIKVDCRFIAATNAELMQLVKAKQFREDLYYRLAVLPIQLPPLRERLDDLPALCASLLQRFAPGVALGAGALELLASHSWPGNVRELRNVIERACIFAEDRRTVLAEDIVL